MIFCIRDCIILLIYFAGGVAVSPSISRDRQGHQIKVIWSGADKPGSALCDAVFCYFAPFFSSCLVSFFNTISPFGLFFFILTADPAGHALGSIYILSLSPEFYFGKGISKAFDLHTGQAYDQIKTISCRDMSLL